ncbi:MAG: adenylate kinase [Paracoccaceae bacterium]
MSDLKQVKIYIFGASGSGTTTLGARIAAQTGLVHVDCDDHFWAPVDPPFSQKQEPAQRLASLENAVGSGGWVLSGACHGWGARIVAQADLVVFVSAPSQVRLKRLIDREHARFGERIAKGGDMRRIHVDFLEWARGYDTADHTGRNRASHDAWLAQLTTPQCHIYGDQPLEESLERVSACIATL